MSVLIYAVCLNCKDKLWVGQGGTLYTGESETMASFREFVDEHIGCDSGGIRLMHEHDVEDSILYAKALGEAGADK